MVIFQIFKKQFLRIVHKLFSSFFSYFHMLVELCASNYATSNGLVNGVDDILKTSITYCEKTIIWIMF